MNRPKWLLFDHLDVHGRNIFKLWTQGLEKRDRAKLNSKLDLLEQYGPDLPPGLLSDTNLPHIKKLRINGPVALRPLLCRGPIDVHGEFTLILGATERDRQIEPLDAEERAEGYKNQISANPGERRCFHERVI